MAMNAKDVFTITLFNRLRSKTPIDTGNMLAHTTMEETNQNITELTISAPMRARQGLMSKRTGRTIGEVKDDYDYARHVNYASNSKHQFWVEHQIKETVNIVMSNVKYGLY